jgi:hypothetical protein
MREQGHTEKTGQENIRRSREMRRRQGKQVTKRRRTDTSRGEMIQQQQQGEKRHAQDIRKTPQKARRAMESKRAVENKGQAKAAKVEQTTEEGDRGGNTQEHHRGNEVAEYNWTRRRDEGGEASGQGGNSKKRAAPIRCCAARPARS